MATNSQNNGKRKVSAGTSNENSSQTSESSKRKYLKKGPLTGEYEKLLENLDHYNVNFDGHAVPEQSSLSNEKPNTDKDARKLSKNAIMENVNKFSIFKTIQLFESPIMSFAWHPTDPALLAFGTDWGDTAIWDVEKDKAILKEDSKNPGRSVQAMKFSPTEKATLFSSTFGGTIYKTDVGTSKRSKIVLTGKNGTSPWCSGWYTSLDVSRSVDLLLAGDNTGNVNLFNPKSKKIISNTRPHSMAVKDIEFHPTIPWLFVTASVDTTVQLWDVRNLKKDLKKLAHFKQVSSARFSPTNGTRLLTTDFDGVVRIFSGSNWDLESTINNPEKQNGDYGLSEASWHPLEEIVLIGWHLRPEFSKRDSAEPFKIHFFDADDGKSLGHLEPTNLGKNEDLQTSINQFNFVGNMMASVIGDRVLLWKPQ